MSRRQLIAYNAGNKAYLSNVPVDVLTSETVDIEVHLNDPVERACYEASPTEFTWWFMVGWQKADQLDGRL